MVKPLKATSTRLKRHGENHGGSSQSIYMPTFGLDIEMPHYFNLTDSIRFFAHYRDIRSLFNSKFRIAMRTQDCSMYDAGYCLDAAPYEWV